VLIFTWMTGLRANESLARTIFGGLNPVIFWKELIQHSESPVIRTVLGIEQCSLFALMMWIGFRKWRRSL
jgi:hypothetical protein